jgi:hypothetical protein
MGNKPIRGSAFLVHRVDAGRGMSHALEQPCPNCNQDCMNTAMVDLVYTYEVCSCAEFPQYPHLVERLWHRQCFINARGALPSR